MFSKTLALIICLMLTISVANPAFAQSQKTSGSSNTRKKPTTQRKQVSKSSSLLASEGVSFRLGIRNRDERSGFYLAHFMVKSPSGTYDAKVNVSSQFGGVSYPEDFELSGAYLSAGLHYWTCVIGGVEVASGEFQFISSSAMAKGRILKFLADPAWEAMASPEIQLAVWDKYDSFEATENAVFTVTQTGDKAYQASQYGVDDWDYVYFPREFKFVGEPNGLYNYESKIGGKLMITGKFEFTEDGKQVVALLKQKWH